jgi:hypothetical protein
MNDNITFLGAGFCAITTPAAGSACAPQHHKGNWHAQSLKSCVQQCLQCPRCYYISFTSIESGCDWFLTCPKVNNGSTLAAYEGDHQTYRVKVEPPEPAPNVLQNWSEWPIPQPPRQCCASAIGGAGTYSSRGSRPTLILNSSLPGPLDLVMSVFITEDRKRSTPECPRNRYRRLDVFMHTMWSYAPLPIVRCLPANECAALPVADCLLCPLRL